MKSLILPAIALLANVTFSTAAVPDEVRGDLGKLLPEMIRLLEAKDYATFLEVAVLPDEFKQITAKEGLEEFVRGFGERKATALLAVLTLVKDKTPKLTEDGNIATYEIPENTEVRKKEIIFTKVEKRWFIKR